MKNIILVTLLAVAAMSTSAADSEVPDNRVNEPEQSEFSDSEMHKCLNAFYAQLQAQIMENLTLSLRSQSSLAQEPDASSETYESGISLHGNLLALNVN